MDCLTCKQHFSQGGECFVNKNNCLFYKNEPRGKMIYTKVKILIDSPRSFETPVIESGAKIVLEDKGKALEVFVTKVISINLNDRHCDIEISYHEKEMPSFEKRKLFRTVD